MKFLHFRIFVILILSFLCINNSEAQTPKDSIITSISFWGNSYYINGQKTLRSQVVDILESDSNTKELISSYQEKRSLGQVTLVAGLLLNAYSIIDLYSNPVNERRGPQATSYLWKLGIGLGLDIVGIILLSNSGKDFRDAISLYNKNVSTSSSGYNIELKLHLNRISLTCSF